MVWEEKRHLEFQIQHINSYEFLKLSSSVENSEEYFVLALLVLALTLS